MSWPYVAQDPNGGWYADCEGLMQGNDPNRTQIEALEWCVDRLASKLGEARHGCLGLYCLLHQNIFDDETIAAMRQQLRDGRWEDAKPDWPTMRIVRHYEHYINTLVQERNLQHATS